MEAIAIYGLVFAAIGLILAGAYGAMPVFIRPQGSHRLSGNGRVVALAGRLPVIEPNFVNRLRARPPIEVLRPQPPVDRARVDSDSGAEDLGETEAILLGLFNEVDLLRGEIEGLRGELCALIEVANNRAAQPARRPRAKSDLPQDIRQHVTQVRRDRGLARV